MPPMLTGQTRVCAVCKGPTTSSCGSCRTVHYCGVAHQKEDWPTHKSRCFKPMASVASIETIPGIGIGLVASTDIKPFTMIIDHARVYSSSSDANDLSGSSAALVGMVLQEASVNADHKDPIKLLASWRFTGQHPGDLARTCKIQSDDLKKLSAEHKVELKVVENTAKVVCLYHYVFGDHKNNGAALYSYMSLMNHSCDPNCHTRNGGRETIIVPLRAVKKGEQLTISYKPHCTAVPYYRDVAVTNFYTMFGGLCRCASSCCVHKGMDAAAISAMKEGKMSYVQIHNYQLANTLTPTHIMSLLKQAHKDSSPSLSLIRMEVAMLLCVCDACERVGKSDGVDMQVVFASIERIRPFQSIFPSDVLCALDQFVFLMSTLFKDTSDRLFLSHELPLHVLKVLVYGRDK